MKYKTPFADLLPPLSSEERESLKADIKANGVMHPVIVDEDGNVLDGHNRLSIDKNAPVKVVSGIPEEAKPAYVIACNMRRRNLSPSQKTEVREKQKAIAKSMKESDPKYWTQKRIAEMLGVDQATVARWLIPNMQPHNGYNVDARVKLPPSAKRAAVDRVESGESQSQVAADLGVSQKTISKEVTKARKEKEKAEEEKKATTEAVKEIKKSGDDGVYLGDSFELAKSLPDKCCSLIFTDPPYDKDSLHMYDDLAQLAGRVLVDGGSLITYLGQYAMPDVMDSMTSHLKFFWPLCCLHTGKTAQMKLFGLKVKWKPMLWFVKGTNRRDTLTWVEDLVVSNQEKDSHPWQQSVVEASYYIERLTKKGELVIDPFCGGGTTAVAAKQLGRKWWTADVNPVHVSTAKARLSDAECK